VELILWLFFSGPILLNLLGLHIGLLLNLINRFPRAPVFSAKISYTLTGLRVMTCQGEASPSETRHAWLHDTQLGLVCLVTVARSRPGPSDPHTCLLPRLRPVHDSHTPQAP
jgi:hypothetical protein